MKPLFTLLALFFISSAVRAESASTTIEAARVAGVMPRPAPPPICVNDVENSIETLTERALGGRTVGEAVLGNETNCLNERRVPANSRVRAADVNRFVNRCEFQPNSLFRDAQDINSLAQLSLRDSQINLFFQDLAHRSHAQIICRVDAMNTYFVNADEKQALNAAAQRKFEQVRQRIQGLILSKRYAVERAQTAEGESNFNCGNPMGGDMCLAAVVTAGAETNGQYEKAIAAEISKIPFGYEPDVANALLAMANSGSFDAAAYERAMYAATNKYRGLLKYYEDRISRQGNGIVYCVDREFKEFSVSHGITDQLLQTYSDDVMPSVNRSIVQCRLNSKYKTVRERFDTGANAAFLVGGGIAAVLTAIPTGGGSLATYGAVAGLGLSAASFAYQVQRAHESCHQRNFLVSSTGGEQCNARQDFDKEISQYSLSSCLAQSGLAALEAVPIVPEVTALFRGRTVVSSVDDLVAELNTPPITVTATRRGSRSATTSRTPRVEDSAPPVGSATPSGSAVGRGAARSTRTESRNAEAAASGARSPTRTTSSASRSTSSLPPLTPQQIQTARQAIGVQKTRVRTAISNAVANSRLVSRRSSQLGAAIERSPESLRSVMRSAEESLASPEKFTNYLEKLLDDVGDDMLNSSVRSIRERALRGEITRNDILRVLVKRGRARGERFSSVRPNNTDAEFETVRSEGPFFDRAFMHNTDSDHGVDMHLLQRDFVASNLNAADLEKFDDMFTYFRTENGGRVWLHMFDEEGDWDVLRAPEAIGAMLRGVLPLR